MFLIGIKGPVTGNVYPLKQRGTVTIGREKDCEIPILGLTISRKHCITEGRITEFYIKDLKSRNKTIVNKNTISDWEWEKLEVNDTITIGSSVLIFLNHKQIPITSVSNFNTLRKSKTRELD